MPIHQTKLMMSKPQPIGTVGPQTPMPRKSSIPIEATSRFSSRKPIPKPTHQPSGVRRLRTIWLILSVTVPKSWPGATSRSASLCSRSPWGRLATSGELRVGVLHVAEVAGARPRAELGQEAVVARLLLGLADAAAGVVDVAEHDRLGRARLLAGGLDLAVADLA